MPSDAVCTRFARRCRSLASLRMTDASLRGAGAGGGDDVVGGGASWRFAHPVTMRSKGRNAKAFQVRPITRVFVILDGECSGARTCAGRTFRAHEIKVPRCG